MKNNVTNLFKMRGGVHPSIHKDESTQLPIAQAFLPEKLIVPVRQHMGIPGQLIIHEGDYVYKGQPITEQPEGLGSITHAPTSGIVSAVDHFPVPHISGYSCPGIIIKPDGKEDWGKYRLPQLVNYQSLDNEILLARIRDCGLIGMGGAAFPSAVKIAGTREHQLETLIINAAECEPYITCDDMLMRGHAHEIIEGIHILMHILKPKHCLIGIEDNKPQAIEAMQDAIQPVEDRSYSTVIQVVKIPTIYPSGDEKQLIKILTGKSLFKQALPINHGLLVHNVATVHSVYNAVIQGRPLISRVVTVTGRGIKNPQNFYTLMGTTFNHLVEQSGGYTDKAERLIMGGPMMGYAMHTDELPVVKMTNCILAIPKEDSPYSSNIAMPCIRCGKCAEACPVDLLPQQLYWHARANDFEKVQEHNLFDCIECGCCSYVCPSNIPLVDYYRFAKSAVRETLKNNKKIEASRERFEFREHRLIRDKEEREAKRAKHKAALQKKKAAMKKKKEVEAAAGGASASNLSRSDAKLDPVQAALERVKAKKAAVRNNPNRKPRNTENLTAAQTKQIEEADKVRLRTASSNTQNLHEAKD